MGNVIKLANFFVFLRGLVTLWQEKIATKAQKHKVSQSIQAIKKP